MKEYVIFRLIKQQQSAWNLFKQNNRSILCYFFGANVSAINTFLPNVWISLDEHFPMEKTAQLNVFNQLQSSGIVLSVLYVQCSQVQGRSARSWQGHLGCGSFRGILLLTRAHVKGAALPQPLDSLEQVTSATGSLLSHLRGTGSNLF